jgi:hypothetical protein
MSAQGSSRGVGELMDATLPRVARRRQPRAAPNGSARDLPAAHLAAHHVAHEAQLPAVGLAPRARAASASAHATSAGSASVAPEWTFTATAVRRAGSAMQKSPAAPIFTAMGSCAARTTSRSSRPVPEVSSGCAAIARPTRPSRVVQGSSPRRRATSSIASATRPPRPRHRGERLDEGRHAAAVDRVRGRVLHPGRELRRDVSLQRVVGGAVVLRPAGVARRREHEGVLARAVVVQVGEGRRPRAGWPRRSARGRAGARRSGAPTRGRRSARGRRSTIARCDGLGGVRRGARRRATPSGSARVAERRERARELEGLGSGAEGGLAVVAGAPHDLAVAHGDGGGGVLGLDAARRGSGGRGGCSRSPPLTTPAAPPRPCHAAAGAPQALAGGERTCGHRRGGSSRAPRPRTTRW